MSYHSAKDPEENLPDWLKSLRKRQNQPEPELPADEPEESVPAPEEEAPPAKAEPDWLLEIRERYRRERGPSAEEAPSDDEPSLSDTQPHRVFPPPEESSLPVDATQEPSYAAEPEIAEEAEPEAADEAEPAVIEKAEPPAEPIEDSTAEVHIPAFTQSDETIAQGDMPSWLQALRPGSFPSEDTRSAEMLPSAEEAGPLAGLSGVLPAELDLAQLGRPPVFSARLDVTENQRLHAAALQRLVEGEGNPVEDETKRTAGPIRLLSIVMSAVLVLAVLFPLVTRTQSAIRPSEEVLPEAAEVYNLIDALPAGAPVLVAFEVQPSLYGELRPLASAILGHLLDKQASLVFISTQPTGPALAEDLIHSQLGEQPAIATGDYANLGYLSGGTAALRSFVGDPRSVVLASVSLPNPWQNPNLETIDRIGAFALVIVIASNAEDARAWIEQSAGSLPGGLLAVTSAQANPMLRAYLQTDPATLRGLVSGLQGAALYERMRGQSALGSEYWDAYSFGLGAIVLSILLGGLYGRLIVTRPEKATGGQRGA